MSIQKSLLRDFSTIALFRYSSYIINFISSMFVARLISPEEYGIFIIVSIVPNFALMFLDSGISSAIIRSKESDEFNEQVHKFIITVGFLMTLLLLISCYPISVFYNNSEYITPILLISFTTFFHSLTIVPQSILSKALNFKTVGLGIFIQAITISSLTILLALIGFSYYSLILPIIFGSYAQYLFFNAKTKLKLKLVGWQEIKKTTLKLQSLLLNVSVFTLFNYWARNIDKLLAGKFFGEASAGIYGRAYSLLIFPLSMITGVFNSIQLPVFNNALQNNVDIAKGYAKSLITLNILTIPFSLVLLLFPTEVVTLLWGNQWSEVAKFLPLVGILVPLQVIASTSGQMFILYKAERNLAIIGVFNAVILILAIILGSFSGIYEILLYYSFSFCLIAFPALIYFGYVRVFRFSIKEISRSILLVWITSIFLLIIVAANKISSIVTLSIYIPLILFSIYLLVKKENNETAL
jgi:O-antigen/teichoic acid export membrane protein